MPDINASIEELKKELEKINSKMEALEKEEPADENSKEYDQWCEKCQELAVKSETVMTMIDIRMSEGLE